MEIVTGSGKLELDPARELIVNRGYSLTPDMVGGWKPRKPERVQARVPFQLRYEDSTTDAIVRELSKKSSKAKEKLLYIGKA
jgi:hypothetical protein